MIFVWSIMMACIVVGFIWLVIKVAIVIDQKIDARRAEKKALKAGLDKIRAKDPFDHLPPMLLELADDVNTPIENVVMLAEDYVVDPPSTSLNWYDVDDKPRWRGSFLPADFGDDAVAIRDASGTVVRLIPRSEYEGLTQAE